MHCFEAFYTRPALAKGLPRIFSSLLLGGWLMSAGAPRARAQLDVVEVEPDSGNFSRTLPFDVPFAITGVAPTGTTGVELQYEENEHEADDFTRNLRPVEALVSGVDGAGKFSFRMEAVEPNHSFRFHITFERRLPGNLSGTFREQVEVLLRRELSRYTRPDFTEEQLQALRKAILLALQRAMNDGQLMASPRVNVSVVAPGTVFDDKTSANGNSQRNHSPHVGYRHAAS